MCVNLSESSLREKEKQKLKRHCDFISQTLFALLQKIAKKIFTQSRETAKGYKYFIPMRLGLL